VKSIKLYILVGLIISVLIVGGVSGFGESVGGKVRNLDSGKQFDTIKNALEDSDTEPGHTIVVDFGEYEEKIYVEENRLTVRGSDPSNRPIIYLYLENQQADSDSFNEVTSEAYGIHLSVVTGSTVQHFIAKSISSKAIADTENIGVDDAIAKSIASGIYLENSTQNYLSHIDIGSVTSYAKAIANDGDATAEAESLGIFLFESDGNTLEYIEVGSLESIAETETSGTHSEETHSYGIFLENSDDNSLLFNLLDSNPIAVDKESTGNEFHFNSMKNVNLTYEGEENLTTSLNWWGSSDGPSYDKDDDGIPEYDGGGGKVSGPASFSPWLADDPDKPGVQLINPLPIIVDDVGPKPTTRNGNTGYLDMAIWGANYVPVDGKIIVNHGTYEAKETMGKNLELISEKGTTCHTCLEDVEDSEITIDGNDITVGKLDEFTPRGFILEDEVLVKSGVDISTIHLNWNDIRNTVENEGEGRLDAEYNWWGDLDPSDSVNGEVDYRPFLPEEPCKFTDYMEEHDIEDPRAAIAGRMIGDKTCSKKLPSQMIVTYHLKPREAEEIVDEYGCHDVRIAMEKAGDNYESFVSVLRG